MPINLEPLFDAEHAAFMQSGVSLSVGSCNATCKPSEARAVGCRIAADYRRVTMLLPVVKAAGLLSDIRANRAIAAVFSQPSTYRTLQLKGSDAIVEAMAEGDLAIAERYRTAFVQELLPLGFPPLLITTFLDCGPEGFVAVSFSPSAAFSQTPGPNAGAPLGARP